MANLINSTFFQGRLSIAQLTEPAVAAEINLLIKQLEPEFLQSLFGYEMYLDLMTEVESEFISAKYQFLLNGKQYEIDSDQIVLHWPGLVDTVNKKSPIANYVYVRYMQDHFTATTGTGEKKPAAQNAVEANPSRKMAAAWNEMVEWNRQLIDYLYYFRVTYTTAHLMNRMLLEKMNPLF